MINQILWNEEEKKYEISTKINITEEEFIKLMDEIFNNKQGE